MTTVFDRLTPSLVLCGIFLLPGTSRAQNSAAAQPQTTTAAAQPPAASAAAQWEPMIVVSKNAQVMAGQKAGPKLPPGAIVYVSTRKEEWLLVPRWNSWIHESHVRSLSTAVAAFTEQIQKQPTAERHHLRGIAYSELGKVQESLQDFNAAIASGMNTSNVFLNRGLAYGRAGDRDKALADFTAAVQRDRKNPQAYFNRAVIYQHAGQQAAALKDFDEAIKLEPTYAEAYNNRGVLRQERGEIALAVDDFEAALKHRPRYPAALTNRAYLRQEQANYAGALEDYAAAIRIAPDSASTLNDLAWLLATCPDQHLRNGETALQYAERACELTNRKVADYLDTLAAAAAECGQFDKAVPAIQAAIQLAPEADRADLQARLKLYQEQKPYHEPKPAKKPADPKAAAAKPN